MSSELNIFGRENKDGGVALFDSESGEVITKVEEWGDVYPVGCRLSCSYDHPGGIIISAKDADHLDLLIEK